ncbi:aldose 1-epimerase family protein [Christensenellaceae bacterium OttesenSCG-928-K19]|nr:aldose 1-epimerase family protein [Christensenellaceae bacterium OttesenSCG-928-K19]
MKKEELRRLAEYVGEMDSLVGMRDFTYNEGKAKGTRAIEMRNGSGLELTVLADRCLDIAYFRYKGTNLGFASKTGVTAPEFHIADGTRGFLKTFNAGMLTTCGIAHAGAAEEYKGRKLGLHGVIGNTPAERVNKELVFDEAGEAVLRVSGRMREACVFEENLFLEREISVDTKRNKVFIKDIVKNEGFDAQPVMNVYHINFGYPLLDEGARLYFSAQNVKARDAEAQKGIDDYNVMEKPQVGYKERVFFHTSEAPQEHSFAMIVSSCGKLGVVLEYDQRQCPILCEWKNMQAGDYALGLEPTVSSVMGRIYAEKEGLMRFVQPGGEYRCEFSLEVLEDEAAIQGYINKAARQKVV